MQRAQLDRPQGYRVRIVIFVIVSLAAAVLQIAWTATASAATLDRVRQTGKLDTWLSRRRAPVFVQG